ncbi:MAG: hypothetical protein ACREAA_13525 [Candidatus Polarisedimenticolia bacterium]
METLLLILLQGAAVAMAASAPPVSSGLLDQAFQFATALVTDDNDRTRAQEAVVQDLAAGGHLEDASRKASGIAGWRRGTAYADLAAHYAAAGRAQEARSLLDKARQFQKTIGGWQEKRIEAHVASALAALGETKEADALLQGLAASDAQYAGRPSAVMGPVLASRGDFDAAMTRLDQLKDVVDPDVQWSRVQGYLDIARQQKLDPARRRKACEMARGAADNIPGWRKPQALAQVADVQRELISPAEARKTLSATKADLESLPATMPVRASLLAEVAGAWTRAGDTTHVRTLLDKAASGIPEMMVIDRPAGWAAVASGYMALKDEAGAKRHYDKSLTEAEGLVNARPRVLAVVEILREMARAGYVPDAATTARLDALRAGLKDPW